VSVGHATRPLREVLAHALPERPFRLELWDGSALPSNGHGELTFRLRSPRALGHVLRAPGQLGLGRAYVSGEIEVDDMDAALELLDGYAVPPLDARGKARLAAAAVRAGALRSVPRVPAAELRPAAAGTVAIATSAPSAITTTSPTTSSASCSASR
jgi:cyclopropane-fatty-acyl-phospholipid synthase